MARYAPIMCMREMARQTVGRTTAFLVAALAGSFMVSCQANPTGPTSRPSATTGTAQWAEWSGSLLTLHMITATIGWGEAFEPRLTPGPLVKRLVLRTADGGHHWQNVTPPALSAQMAGELPSEYLDQDRAFVMALAGPGQIRVMRTSDGGTHWQDTILHDPKVVERLSETGSAQFSFVDANHGWLFVSYGYDGDEAGAVYKTIDGGRQWSVASRTDPTGVVAAQSLGRAPRRASHSWIRGTDGLPQRPTARSLSSMSRMTPVRVGLKLHTRTCRASICPEAMQSHDLDSFLRHQVNSRSLPETPLCTPRPMAAPAGGRQYRQAAANSSFSM